MIPFNLKKKIFCFNSKLIFKRTKENLHIPCRRSKLQRKLEPINQAESPQRVTIINQQRVQHQQQQQQPSKHALLHRAPLHSHVAQQPDQHLNRNLERRRTRASPKSKTRLSTQPKLLKREV